MRQREINTELSQLEMTWVYFWTKQSEQIKAKLEKKSKLCGDVWLVTQHCKPNDADVAPPSVREVVDQALVRPGVGQLSVVYEDGGTCAWHRGHKAHTTVEAGGETKHLATLVNDHLIPDEVKMERVMDRSEKKMSD